MLTDVPPVVDYEPLMHDPGDSTAGRAARRRTFHGPATSSRSGFDLGCSSRMLRIAPLVADWGESAFVGHYCHLLESESETLKVGFAGLYI